MNMTNRTNHSEEEAQRFTIAQLRTLKRQIQSFRRININLKALKSGNDLVNSRSDIEAINAHRLAPKKRGRACAKPGVGQPSARAKGSKSIGLGNIAAESGEKSEEANEVEDFGSDDDSEVSNSPEFSLDSVDTDAGIGGARQGKRTATAVRRQSLREKKIQKSLKESSDSGDEASESSEMETGSPAKEPMGKPPRKKKFIFLTADQGEDTSEIRLEILKPVRVPWPADEAAVCSVCGDGDTTDDNVILLCDGEGCDVSAHQACYGIPNVPKDEWKCDGCKAKLNPKSANCALCPVVGGALRKIANLGKVVKINARPVFVHLACVLWTPETRFNDPGNMSKVDIGSLSRARMELRCSVCKQGGGGVIQCSYGSCCTPFHPLCGRFAGHELNFRSTDGEPLAFCSVHSRPQFKAARFAILRGLKQGEGGQHDAAIEELTVEPAELVEYELQRQSNLKRIEEAKKAIFNEGK